MKTKRFVTVARMRRIENLAVSRYGIPLLLLMEHAGLACVDVLLEQKVSNRSLISVFCGPGNNGGDGFVIARNLINRGYRVQVFHFPSDKAMSDETRINFMIYRNMKAPYFKNPSISKIEKSVSESAWCVDALFGIGLTRPLSAAMSGVVRLLNDSDAKILSVDIPSGMNADTGQIMGDCVRPDITVTFGFAKKGFLRAEAMRVCGQIIVRNLFFS